jgi:hypothetical protein
MNGVKTIGTMSLFDRYYDTSTVGLYIHPLKKTSERQLNFHCLIIAFNHLKAQPISNGKTMSNFWFSCHPNVYHCAFKHLSAQQSMNGNTMSDILIVISLCVRLTCTPCI